MSSRAGRAFAWLAGHWRLLTALALIAALLLAGYLVYLDRLISETFQGRRWSVPAIVYAAPLELHPGAGLSSADVSAELARLGYEPDSEARAAGTYDARGDDLWIHLRDFRFISDRVILRTNSRAIPIRTYCAFGAGGRNCLDFR